jgi:hypothetical protein
MTYALTPTMIGQLCVFAAVIFVCLFLVLFLFPKLFFAPKTAIAPFADEPLSDQPHVFIPSTVLDNYLPTYRFVPGVSFSPSFAPSVKKIECTLLMYRGNGKFLGAYRICQEPKAGEEPLIVKLPSSALRMSIVLAQVNGEVFSTSAFERFPEKKLRLLSIVDVITILASVVACRYLLASVLYNTHGYLYLRSAWVNALFYSYLLVAGVVLYFLFYAVFKHRNSFYRQHGRLS